MTYQLAIMKEPTYLHARVTGRNSPGAVRSYLADIYAACVDWNVGAVLIEENLEGPGLTLTEIYQVIADSSQQTWPHVRRLAFVDLHAAHRPGNIRFGETVALNRGVNVRSFLDVESAKSWLLHDEGSQ